MPIKAKALATTSALPSTTSRPVHFLLKSQVKMGKPLDKSKRQENGAHEQEDQQEADAEVDMAIDTRSNPDVSEEAKKVSACNMSHFEPVSTGS